MRPQFIDFSVSPAHNAVDEKLIINELGPDVTTCTLCHGTSDQSSGQYAIKAEARNAKHTNSLQKNGLPLFPWGQKMTSLIPIRLRNEVDPNYNSRQSIRTLCACHKLFYSRDVPLAPEINDLCIYP